MDCFKLGKQKQILLKSLSVIAAYMRQGQSTKQKLAKTNYPLTPKRRKLALQSPGMQTIPVTQQDSDFEQ